MRGESFRVDIDGGQQMSGGAAGSAQRAGAITRLAACCMLLAMGGVGRGSNVERFSDQGVMQQVWGTIPGFDAMMRSRPDEPRLNPGIVLFLSGLVLVALGVTVL